MADSTVHPPERIIDALPSVWVGFVLAGVVLLTEMSA
jgi:hypothetical protein